jgi:hypothetical protein
MDASASMQELPFSGAHPRAIWQKDSLKITL